MATNKYNIYIFILILISIFLTVFIIPNYFSDYAKVINLIIWICIFIASLSIPNEHSRFKAKSEKVKTVVIIVIIYYILYLLLGLVYGYSKSPYAHDIINVIKNITLIFVVVLLQEYVRAKLINSTKSIYIYTVVTIVFILLKLDYHNFTDNFSSNGAIFKYFSSVLFVEIMASCLSTYLCTVGGYILNYAYIIPTTLAQILLPIFPQIDWFLDTTIHSVMLLLNFLFVNHEHLIRTSRYTRREINNMTPAKSIPTVILLLVFVAFVAGVLPYKPIAIMSYSMVPSFSRGHVVISRKLKPEEVKNLRINDVIEYTTENIKVIHRIIDINKDENGNLVFTTKGDNNKTQDLNPVKEEQVIGIVRYTIPFVGYPSVWFSEIVFSTKSVIEI